jgi:hypothetical protein
MFLSQDMVGYVTRLSSDGYYLLVPTLSVELYKR